MTIRPLPRRLPPLQDELLSSWVTRLAAANYCSVPELLGYLGFSDEQPPDTSHELQGTDINRFGALARLSSSDVRGMLLVRRAELPVEIVSCSDFQHCPTCTQKVPGISLRHWRYAWSMACNSCGTGLLPLGTALGEELQVPARLKVRASKGAAWLEQLYLRSSQHVGRQLDLALQVVRVLAPELRHAGLCSKSRHDRYTMLAAVHLLMTRPLVALSIAMRRDPAARDRLRMAFPGQRNLLDQLVHLSCSSPTPAKDDRKIQKAWFPASKSDNTTKPDFLAAAKKAIEQLGVNADRAELLRCADRTLEKSRR